MRTLTADERAEVVKLWRSAIGTRFGHMGRRPGVSLDCGGLILLPCVQLGVYGEDYPEPYARRPRRTRLIPHIRQYLLEIPVSDVDVADVLVMEYNSSGRPQHFVGVTQVEPMRIVHAYCESTDRGGEVVETYAGPSWPNKILEAFSYQKEDE